MQKICATLLFLLTCLGASAQSIADVEASLRDQEIIVSYSFLNVAKDQTYSVGLWYSIDGKNFKPCHSILCPEGNCDEVHPAEQNTIIWSVLNDVSSLVTNRIQFEVRAWPSASMKPKNFTETFGIDMVYIQGGKFTMGMPASDTMTQEWEREHEVELSPFWIGKYEVTQRQWREVMGSDPPELEHAGCDNCPVERVSWNDIQSFLALLNQKTGKTYCLPTEAQWEYACRAGTTTSFNTGNCLSSDQANFNSDYPYKNCPGGQSNYQTVAVGTYPPNAWGLYDMHGNVIELCSDWLALYPIQAVKDPKGPEAGPGRVGRGGSWGYGSADCRSGFRNGYIPTKRHECIGFRIVLNPSTKP